MKDKEVPPDWVKGPKTSPGGVIAGILVVIMVVAIVIMIFWPDPLLRFIFG